MNEGKRSKTRGHFLCRSFTSSGFGQRPVLIIQNDVGNHFSTTVIVAPITTHSQKKPMPTHVPLTTKVTGIPKNSVVLLEQVRTIDKQRLMDRIDHLDTSVMKKVNQGLRVSLSL